jgi:hypothetical protein
MARMAGRLDELVRQTVAAWAADPAPDIVEPGVVHVKLGLADPDFAPCCDHPLLAQTATAVLGPDWHLGALSLRAPLPGCGHQGLHPDFAQRRTEGAWQTLSAMWCITAFTPDNGPLRVIPGSHRVSEPPIDMLAFGSGMGPHPDEVKIVAPAGSVITFNSADLWHSGTFNYSPAPRLAVTAGFSLGHSPSDLLLPTYSPEGRCQGPIRVYVNQAPSHVLVALRPARPLMPYRRRITIRRQSGGGHAASAVIPDQVVIVKPVAAVLSPTMSVAGAHIRGSRHVDPIEGWLS